MSQPLRQALVFRDVMVNHQGVDARFADHQGVLDFPVIVQPEHAALIAVELTSQALIQRAAHQATKVGQAEPGL